MRDRLIEELDSADLFLRNRANSSPAPLNEYDIEEMLDIAKICDEAARTLEKAIIPPVSVGQKVYVYNGFVDKVVEGIVYAFTYFKQYRYITVCDDESGTTPRFQEIYEFSDIGKTVFLTREEAEQKLRRGKG